MNSNTMLRVWIARLWREILECLQGPPSNQEAAPLGLMPDLEDDPMTMEDAVNEDNPEIRLAAF